MDFDGNSAINTGIMSPEIFDLISTMPLNEINYQQIRHSNIRILKALYAIENYMDLIDSFVSLFKSQKFSFFKIKMILKKSLPLGASIFIEKLAPRPVKISNVLCFGKNLKDSVLCRHPYIADHVIIKIFCSTKIDLPKLPFQISLIQITDTPRLAFYKPLTQHFGMHLGGSR